MLHSGSRSFDRFGLGGLVLGALVLGLCAPSDASATPVISSANIPFSGISPGGVNAATGELILVLRPDLFIEGPLPVSFERYYASMLARGGVAAGPLGPNWLGTYDWSLSVSMSGATVVTNRGAVIQFTQSPVGGWTLLSPTYSPFRLDQVGAGWRFTNPLDRRLYFFDGATHLLTQIMDEHGNALTLSRNAAGRLTQVADGLGRTISFSYDASGLMTQASDGLRTVHYVFTAGVLTTFIDAEARPWAYGYQAPPEPDMPALLIGVTEPVGNTPLQQSYDPFGRVASQSDAAGFRVTYQYDTPSGTVFSDPLRDPWTYQHDAQNRLAMVTDPGSGQFSFTYDPSGRLFTASRPMGDLVSLIYDQPSGYPSIINFPDGSQAHWTYSSHISGGGTFFDVATAVLQDGSSESYVRDAAGDLTDRQDAAGFHWTATYNLRGQALTSGNPTQGTTSFAYDPQGRLESIQDNAGNTTHYGYDALSRVTLVTWADAATRGFEYDNLDGLTRITDELGGHWGCSYDANERLTTMTDPLLRTTGYGYDGLDRVTQVQDPLGHATLYGYDPKGRLTLVTDRSGRTTQYSHDPRNRLIGIADPTGAAITFVHDSDGRMTSAQDPLGHSFLYQYDAMDRVIHVTDPVSTGFDYGYDPMGRLLSATGPLGFHLAYQYDARGLPTSFTDGTSQTGFLYTPLGEISQVTDPNRNAWPRQYDPQGRMISAADPLGRSEQVQFDARSRPIHALRQDGSTENIIYDAKGRPILIDGPFDGNASNTTVSYGYDSADQLTSASGATFSYDAAGRMITSNGFGFSYDAEGRVLSETLSPGKAVSYSYDSRGLLSQVGDWMGGTTSFSYDAAHRCTGMGRPNGTAVVYQYDSADRLISAVEVQPGPQQTPLSSIVIGRDALGRATSIDRRQPLMPGATSPSNAAFAYDAASQLAGVSHDAFGRMTSDAARAFAWDGLSRLARYTAGADSPRFAYDAFGQRLTSTIGAQTVQQAWSYARGTPDVDDMMVTLPTRSRLYVRTPSGLMLYGVDGATGARSFYHYDEAGNTAFLTNDGGSVTTGYSYSPFGSFSALGLTADNPFTFGAANGLMALGSSDLWGAPGGAVYDGRTMRDISGLVTSSGPALFMKTPGPPQVGGKDPGPQGLVWVNPGPVQVGWKAPGPNGFGWKAPGPGGFGWKNPGPSGFGWRNPGPAGLGWKNPGPPGFGWRAPGPVGLGWRNPGPNGLGWKDPGPSGFGWRDPGPPGFGWKDPGPIGFVWKDPGPPGLGWRDPGPQGLGWKSPGPAGFVWRNPGPTGTGWRQPGPNGFDWKQPGPIGVTEGVGFFKSVGGLSFETEVVEYEEGGISGDGFTRAPGGGPKHIALVDYFSPDLAPGATANVPPAAPCMWCFAPYGGSDPSGEPSNDIHDVNR